MKHGFTSRDWQLLARALRLHAAANHVRVKESTKFGTRYVVDEPLPAPDGTVLDLRCVWFISNQQVVPRFVTAHPLRKGTMIRELDDAVLECDLPGKQLARGDLGTVVLIHRNGEGYEVEFTTLHGETVAVVTLGANQIRAVRSGEIADARGISHTA